MNILGLQVAREVQPGDDLAALILGALSTQQFSLETGDVLVVAQKVVSKAEGRLVELDAVSPSPEACELAERLGKDPTKVQVILGETRTVEKAVWPPGRAEGLLIVEHRLGHIMANAGVDASNTGGEGRLVLLPEDPDASARRLADALRQRTGQRVAVIVSDTFGRPWRRGLVNVAIGVGGMCAVKDLRGERDSEGRELKATVLALADEIAAAAGLVIGKLTRMPVAIVRGIEWEPEPDNGVSPLLRPVAEDVFR